MTAATAAARRRGLSPLPVFALFAALLALVRPLSDALPIAMDHPGMLAAIGAVLAACGAMMLIGGGLAVVAALAASHFAAFTLVEVLPAVLPVPGAGFWAAVIASWLTAWAAVERLAALEPRSRFLRRLVDLAVPLVFGIWLLILWELLTRGLGVPAVLLPSPSAIAARMVAEVPTLWADFRQTFLKAVLIGYAMGCGSGFLVALAVDRVQFLKRGLLPVGNLVSALPIIGVAPIMVMWFGFDWPSKAAVVVIMTFFPMLVNTLAGLEAAGRMERDLMRTYAAGHGAELLKLRLPAAMPFVFNALKINSTLALIGAIVAEFFGTPIVGMGFRISTEVGRMAIDMVWAEIAVAAVAGSLFYGLVSLIERSVTFWHPSFR
jgi:NitT/TauT family transport system permease protein